MGLLLGAGGSTADWERIFVVRCRGEGVGAFYH